METLASFFIRKPLHSIFVANFFLVAFLATYWYGPLTQHSFALLVPVVAWSLYALWEWLISFKNSDADIRVDLLLIWPILLIISIGSLVWILLGRR